MAKSPTRKEIDTLTHDEARRINNPTAEMASLFEQQQELLGGGERSMRLARARPLPNGETRERDGDLDPQIVWNGARIRITREQMQKLAETGELEIGDTQLVWRGKDRQDWSDLVVNAPPIYVQEKVHPKAIIDDLKRRSDARREARTDAPDLFADFNGLADPEARAEFYRHALHWTNRFILGDSLQVMASLAEREGLRGKVQCIYFDPPYGIRFNSNWQVSTLSRDVKDGKKEDVSREPEQVKAFRDTWKDGIHSYLAYLRDRLMVARELLSDSGSIFVQIGDENVHRVRAVMDEVFGESNLVATIVFATTSSQTSEYLPIPFDYILFYSKRREYLKYRPSYVPKNVFVDGQMLFPRLEQLDGVRTSLSEADISRYAATGEVYGRLYRLGDLTSQRQGRPAGPGTAMHFPVSVNGKSFYPTGGRGWSTTERGLVRLQRASRIEEVKNSIRLVRYLDDFPYVPAHAYWEDTGTGSFTESKVYVVQTGSKAVQRCMLMTTDPG